MPKRLRDKALQSLLRQVAKTAPPNDPILRPFLYKLLLTSRRFMAKILDSTHQQSIRLFLRQQDVVFDCAAFGIINCGQTFDYQRALILIKLFSPETIELVLIGRNLKPADLQRFLIELKAIVPSFTTSHHRHLARSVEHLQQRCLLETLADKLQKVELWENQLTFLHRSSQVLDKCVVHCKSNLGYGQLALALRTKTRLLVGRYRIQEFFTCGDIAPQQLIEELQLSNDDTAWRVFCEPDSIRFFQILREKLPNLRRLIFGMSERWLLRGDQRWSGDCVEDLMMQIVNFKRSAFLNRNHDLREHCRTQILNTLERAISQNIQLFLCYETKSMFSIHDTARFWPLHNGDKGVSGL